jgi:hypothetical protein
MQLSSNTHAIGEHAYLIESPAANVNDCLVIAHGASVGSQTFIVPPGKVVQFFVPDRVTNLASSPADMVKNAALCMNNFGDVLGRPEGEKDKRARKALVFANQAKCQDYVLGKMLGDHFTAGQTTYVEMRQTLDRDVATLPPGANGNWVPHVVTVRNRKSTHQYIWLSALIRDLLNFNPALTTFYCANCRIRSKTPAQHLSAAGRQA